MERREFILSSGAAIATTSLPQAAAREPEPAKIEDGFAFAFPLFEFARTAWEAAGPIETRPSARYNQLVHRRSLTDHTSRAITAVNNDALLSSARIDLSTGPLVLEFPSILDRYFSTALMDAFTDNFAMFGTRASGGRGGRVVLTPPGWRGKAPEGSTLVAAPTTDVWMLVRILTTGPGDVPTVNALQDLFKLGPLEEPAPAATFISVRPRDVRDPENFLAVCNAMLSRVPTSDRRLRRSARYAQYGLRREHADTWSRLPAHTQAAWRQVIPDTLERMRQAGQARQRVLDGWSYTAENNGAFGDDNYLRAVVALYGLAALPAEEALYALAMQDSTGAALDGNGRFRLRLPAGGPPVGAFWSVTCYQVEPDGRLFLVDNPLRRYSIGDRTPALKRNEDGSIDILFQRDAPEEALAANWLPTPPGRFQPAFRFYLPSPQLRALQWRLPPLERL